jgi:hypothetical protein
LTYVDFCHAQVHQRSGNDEKVESIPRISKIVLKENIKIKCVLLNKKVPDKKFPEEKLSFKA